MWHATICTVYQDVVASANTSNFYHCRRELSTDQVNKPVNTEALTKWVGHIPPDVIHDMDSIAPMLRRLGYDPDSSNPTYGKPDEMVAKQSAELSLQNKFDRASKNDRDNRLRQN